MSTAVDYRSLLLTTTRSRHHHSSQTQPSDGDNSDDIELGDFNSPPPPAYTEQAESNSPSSTHQTQTPLTSPTLHFQIETAGKPILSFPLPPHPDPIPIYLVDPSAPNGNTASPTTPKYISLRPSRGSGSCYLISGDSDSSSLASPPPSTTTYRFGPGRPPRVRIFNPHSLPQAHQEEGESSSPRQDQDESTAYSSFDILSSGLFTRAVRFKPPRLLEPGSSDGDDNSEPTTDQYFEWRYASRQERKTYSSSSPSSPSNSSLATEKKKIDSLLILSKVTRSSTFHLSQPSISHGNEIPIARLIRSSELRTKGSSASSAGNGGRLEILDLEEAGFPENKKTKREMLLVMVVTTCLVMLKREVDRRRAQQIALLSTGGAVGGGGG